MSDARAAGLGTAAASPLRAPEIALPRPSRPVHAGEVLVLALLFVLGLEIACRIDDWIQYKTPFFARERSVEDLLVRDALGMHGRPGGHFEKWSLNSFGMRGPEVPRTKPTGVLRIVASGASETFGLYESPAHEYPRQLEDSLNARFAAGDLKCVGTRAEVLNAGMPGMSLPTIEQDVRLRVAPLSPDFVVLYPTPPGYLEDSPPKAAQPDTLKRTPTPLPGHYALFPRVASRVRIQVKKLLPTAILDALRRQQIRAKLEDRSDEWRFTSVPQDRVSAYEGDLRRAVGTIRSIGAVPVVMTHANRFLGSSKVEGPMLRAWEKFYPRATGRTIVAFDSATRLKAIAVATDSQTVLVDLARALMGKSDESFTDFSHFTDAGAGVAAGLLSGAITSAANSRCR